MTYGICCSLLGRSELRTLQWHYLLLLLPDHLPRGVDGLRFFEDGVPLALLAADLVEFDICLLALPSSTWFTCEPNRSVLRVSCELASVGEQLTNISVFPAPDKQGCSR